MNSARRALIFLTIVALLPAARCPAAPPPPKVSPEAAELLKQMTQAYAALKTLELAGTDTMESTDLRKKTTTTGRAEFHASYAFPDKFRIESGALKTGPDDARPMKPAILAVCDGKQLRAYDPASAQKFVMKAKAPTERLSSDPKSTLGPIATVVAPLTAPLYADPAAQLIAYAESVTKVADVQIDGTACPALALKRPFNLEPTIVVLDPKTHLIRRYITTSISPNIQKAVRTTDLTTVTPDADVKPDAFDYKGP